jgi:hypothetical protein
VEVVEGDEGGVVDAEAEEAGGEGGEARGIVGDEATEGADDGSGVALEFGGMESAEDVLGAFIGGVDDGDAWADDFGDEVFEDGVVGAAEDEDVDVFGDEWEEVLLECESDDGVIV